MKLSQKECQILRKLAKKYAECSENPAHEEKKKLWIALNDGHMQRPMVLIDQLPWNELEVDESLLCQVEHPYWQRFEKNLRRKIYMAHNIPSDLILYPYFLLPRRMNHTGFGINPIEDRKQSEGKSVSSHKYYNQFETMEDILKIQPPHLIYDREAEAEVQQQADEIFEGILPYHMVGETMHLGVWDWIAQWMGVEECYYALLDNPEMIHAMLCRIVDGLLSLIDEYNQFGLFDGYSHICHCSCTLSERFPGQDADADRPKSQNSWAFGLAQLFTSASPQTTREFEVPYMSRIFEKFGAIYYGCCERLDDRLDIVSKMPNIRKISCSPWSDRERFAANLPKHIIMSNKPNPALLADSIWDEDAVRKDIRRTIQAARENHVPLEMILKDVSTVCNQPFRVKRWGKIALEEASR